MLGSSLMEAPTDAGANEETDNEVACRDENEPKIDPVEREASDANGEV